MQSRARKVGLCYAVLALYYAAVAPLAFRAVQWGSWDQITTGLSARGDVLFSSTAYIVVNVLLAIFTWRATQLGARAGRALVALSAVVTVWMAGTIGVAILRALMAFSAPSGIFTVGIGVALLVSYVACWIGLWSTVASVARQRESMIQNAQPARV